MWIVGNVMSRGAQSLHVTPLNLGRASLRDSWITAAGANGCRPSDCHTLQGVLPPHCCASREGTACNKHQKQSWYAGPDGKPVQAQIVPVSNSTKHLQELMLAEGVVADLEHAATHELDFLAHLPPLG